MKDLLNENGCGHIKIFGGGGGTILPEEIEGKRLYEPSRNASEDRLRQWLKERWKEKYGF